MITKTKTLIMSILCLLPLIPAAAQHVSVNLKVPPPNQLGVADLWNLTLNNTTQNTLKVYLEGTVDEASDGRILEARSKEFDLSPGIRSITANDVSGAGVSYKNNKYKEILLRTGNAPPGNYYFCVYVKLQDGIEAGSDCKSQSIMNLSPPALVSPSDGLSITEIYPSFSWMPPSPISPGQNISYSIKIVEMRSQESPDQAIKSSGFEAHDLNRNFFHYPVSASALEKGKNYAWQVTAFENGSSVGKSEIWNFSVEGVPTVKTQNFKDFLMVLSGIVLELDRTVYPEGTSISAKLYIDSGDVHIKNPAILYSAPQSKDVEAIKLVKTSNDSVYETERSLPIKPFTSDGDVKVNDGSLTLKPNEMFFGIYLPKDSADMGNHIGPDFVADFGIMEDKNFRESPFQIISQLAMTEDEINIPPGGKRIGTVTVNQGYPIQLPVDELIIYPRSDKQLRRFLQKTSGEIVMTNADNDTMKPTGYLVRVHTDVRLQDFSQVRAVLQKTDMVYASNADVLRIITLCIETMLDGYLVDVNPRLQFGNSYTGNALVPTSFMDIPKYDDAAYGNNLTDTAFNIPRVWSYMSLWDADEKRIPVAIIDMGFNYCPDFRGTRDGIIEHDMKTGSDKPRSAEGPPTVGNSFFGPKSWHGTGVVTVAGGVVNNKFGSGGTGGQVVEPILISVGMVNYAFEMGKGMKIATDRGANIINISGGYPCKFLTNILPPLGSCAAGETALTCKLIAGALSAAVFLAAEITCATLGWLPFGVGPAICAAAKAAAWATFAATQGVCDAFFLAGFVKTEMESGVNYALSKGVTVVSISGNKIDKSGLPDPLDKIVNTSNMNVDDWMIIPGVLPGVICVAACNPNPPYSNEHYFGNRVDIWAPQDAVYWAPPKTDKIEDDPKKLTQQPISATSSTVPYICGLIADMQALNDELNPKKTTMSDKSKIPGIIRNLLVDNTYLSGVQLTASSERRNMVNPLRTLIAASPQVIQNFQDFSLKNYNTSLGYDEADVKKRYDDKNTAYNIMFLQTMIINPKFKTDPVFHGVVGLTDGANHRDADWFNIIYPSDPGVYGDGILQITIPYGSVSKFGRIKINGTLYPPVQNSIKPDESTIEVKIPDMLYGCDFPVKIEGYIWEDNVYNLKFIPGKRVGDAPEADKLDKPNDLFKQSDNNSKGNATPLGKEYLDFKHQEFTWGVVKKDNLYTYYEINVTDLNFHICGDSDWFEITPPPGLKDICGHMMCSAPITVSCTKEGKPVNVLISVYDNSNNTMNEDVLSGLDIGCADPNNGYPLYMKLWGAGAPIKYNLKLSVNIPIDVKKFVEKCDETWKWITTLKYPPIKLNQNWWCEWGLDPVGFTIDWTNNGGFNWSGGGMSFLMQGTVMNGGLQMQLFNSQGNLICQSASSNPISVSAGVVQSDVQQGASVLTLEQPNLQEGTYLLMLSGGSTRNQVQLLLPRNLLSANLPAIEDLQGMSEDNYSSPESSSYTLIPAYANQQLIFR